MNFRDYESFSREELIGLLKDRDADETGGLRLYYKGQTQPWRIVRRVQPRRQKIEQKLSFGPEEDQASNLIVEGENLHAVISLYKYRGQIDLVLADPPCNTGSDFRCNDKWDEDPNDPDLGALVPAEDGSRHSKWLRFMVPRLWAMREMLPPSGVLAICIDQRELFRLGMVLDDMFGEANRLALINWQKTMPKNDAGLFALSFCACPVIPLCVPRHSRESGNPCRLAANGRRHLTHRRTSIRHPAPRHQPNDPSKRLSGPAMHQADFPPLATAHPP